MRVLVTGGAGFIGSHLTDAFAGRGDDVTVVDDLSSGRPGRLAADVSLHKLSIGDGDGLAAIVAAVRPALICHLAAQIDVRASVAAPADDARVNIVGTVHVLEAARTVGARVLLASTGGALYGRNAPIPSAEELIPEPEAPYGTAKHCAEQYIGLYNRLYGTRHAVLRLANVYGPRQDPAGEAGVIAIFCGRALRGDQPLVYGGGGQTRDYVYVGDVADAFIAAAGTARPGTWNIGTGVETSVLDLITVVGRAAGRELKPELAPPRPGELQRSVLAVSRAQQDLGWTAGIPLADGVERVYRWIEAGKPARATR